MKNNFQIQSPSNIALVKYWGKRNNQIPQNPSVSFTLSKSFTTMDFEIGQTNHLGIKNLTFEFEGKTNEKFRTKIIDFLQSVSQDFSFFDHLNLHISSKNSFPHSAGIASSASSMSALALGICQIEENFSGNKLSETDFQKKASFYARLASGSACRSVFPKVSLWGKTPFLADSSDEYAIAFPEIDPIFEQFHDAILLVSKQEKAVSSRAGHSLMNNNPFAEVRYAQAKNHTEKILIALKTGNLETFIEIVEQEALTLHALMMSSKPSFVLLQPNSLVLIEKIRDFREKTAIPVCFTIDAGPNIHLLYPKNVAEKVEIWIAEELHLFCENGQYLLDKMQ